MLSTYEEMKIEGIKIKFPYKPYASQLSMMNRIVFSLNNKQNSLLESPTGTGKTMALLCSTIAWVRNNYEEKRMKLLNFDDSISKDELNEELDMKNIRIYYCSRTHKQVSQVVRELSRSPYRNIAMDIIGSRRHSCINKNVLESGNIDEECNELNLNSGCNFRNNVSKKCMPIPSEPWTIESIKSSFKKMKICPYYQSRDWINQAEIILCPYNYILNPSIRKSTNISLKNAIVILDEAHNIEDVCRDSASVTISQEDFIEFRLQLFGFLKICAEINAENLINFVNKSHDFIKVLSSKLYFNFDESIENSWLSSDIIPLLLDNGFTQVYIKKCKGILQSILKKKNSNKDEVITIGDDDDDDDDGETNKQYEKKPKISDHLLKKVEIWIQILLWILGDSSESIGKYSEQFRFMIEEGKLTSSENELPDTSGNWLNSRKRKSKAIYSQMKTNFVMNIWCMDPSVIFNDIMNGTHSIILTSGTLAPMSSFQKELSCQFESTLEAFHVVKKNQVVVATVSHGPSGQALEAVYRNVHTYPFQDELGRLIRQCCQVVPNGILCFVSSFSLMDKLYERWNDTGLLSEIERYKPVLKEPRTNEAMDDVMNQFYNLKNTGVLLMAVYRGKASEGMDFSDNAARLVITVGIPYPSRSDPQVLLKENYNNMMKTKGSTHVESNDNLLSDRRNIISGKEWYFIQAFRALNQAMGRCIRHRNDWGAILLVDSRFQNTNCCEGLCKWIRRWITHYNSWGSCQMELENFVKERATEHEADTFQ